MLPITFLIIGTIGVLLLGMTMTPVLNDRGAVTIRARIAAIAILALGMVAFGISFVILG